MKIYTDNEIFELQKFGGISRIFQDFLNEGLLQKVIAPAVAKPNLLKRFLRKLDLTTIVAEPSFESLIDSIPMDLFHPSYYTHINPENLKTPYVLTVHDMINELYPEIFDIDTVSNSKLHLISRARRIIAVSQQTKSDLLKLVDVKEEYIDVVPLYTRFHLNTSTSPRQEYSKDYILYVGNRKVYKNFKRFVLAMQPILVKNKELSVICTGPLLNQDELNYLDIIGLGNRFTSVMCANDSELKWFYENAICFVFPSLYEGFGFPLLEAFASNCPIVSSAGGSLPEVGGDACIYFNPMDIDDMREKILFTIENKGIRDEMSRKGALRLTEYSLEKTLALTRQSYLTALSDY